jgi:hypothetical protein
MASIESKFLLYSAHYPTLLTLAASMQLGTLEVMLRARA